jgi:membrane protein DedA with SNARE-associated domain
VLFMFMFFETSMIFPFIPSEFVIPVAAVALVSSLLSLSFALFVLAAAAGAVVGSLFAYYVSGAATHWLLERYGPSIHVSEQDAARAERWFRHWGESSVFWGRFLPILRSVISIPAGIARMHVGKFAVYSGAGSGLFAAVVAAFVVTGREVLPTQLLIQWTVTLLNQTVASAIAYPPLTVAVAGILLFAVFAARNAFTKRLLF